MCVAWREGTRAELPTAPIKVWWPGLGPKKCKSLLRALKSRRIVKVAHNSFFEKAISRNVLAKHLDEEIEIHHEDWICTAALGAPFAYPRKLERLCSVLKLQDQKDMAGHRVMLKMSKPRKPTKKDPRTRHDDPEDFDRMVRYCVKDLRAETGVFLRLPPLGPNARKLWLLDQTVNTRGVTLDRPAIGAVLKMVETEIARLNAHAKKLTGGAIEDTNKLKKLKAWLDSQGVNLPNLQAKTIEDALEAGLVKGKAATVLRIRQSAGQVSIAKYYAFEARTRSDSILRDFRVWHGASTGRDTGQGAQMHNLPRGSIKDAWDAVELIRYGDVEFLRAVYGDPLKLFSACIRSMIIPRKGNTFFCGDYASIEVRVLFWMANHVKGLRAYRNNEDLYISMASAIFDVSEARIRKGIDAEIYKYVMMRELGKRAILGCGYGMGAKKFFDTCKKYNQPVTMDLAKKAVKAYRELHGPVPAFWSNMEEASIRAVRNPGKVFKINRVAWYMKGEILFCKLPSGRKLAYHRPFIRFVDPPWVVAKRAERLAKYNETKDPIYLRKSKEEHGDKLPALHHWSTHPTTKQWGVEKIWGGVEVENIVQAVAADYMTAASLRLEDAGYENDLSIYDELLCEKKRGNVEEFRKLMAEAPPWAEGLPIAVKAWSGPRYKKD